MTMPRPSLKHNAIGTRTCNLCRHWHNPDGEPMGLCIRYPPAALLVGMQPMRPPAIMDPNAPPAMAAMPIVLGFHPPRPPDWGCGEWIRRTDDMN